jgi:hypothetical protein
MEDTPEGLMLMLLREGSTDHAIELYREEMGVDRREAVRVATELCRCHGIPLRRTSLLPLLAVGVATLLTLVVAM